MREVGEPREDGWTEEGPVESIGVVSPLDGAMGELSGEGRDRMESGRSRIGDFSSKGAPGKTKQKRKKMSENDLCKTRKPERVEPSGLRDGVGSRLIGLIISHSLLSSSSLADPYVCPSSNAKGKELRRLWLDKPVGEGGNSFELNPTRKNCSEKVDGTGDDGALGGLGTKEGVGSGGRGEVRASSWMAARRVWPLDTGRLEEEPVVLIIRYKQSTHTWSKKPEKETRTERFRFQRSHLLHVPFLLDPIERRSQGRGKVEWLEGQLDGGG